MGTRIMSERKLSIVIPAYKESRRIIPTLESIRAFIASVDYHVELVVVEDGSPLPDDTLDVLREQATTFEDMRVLQHPDKQNHGKGWTVRHGMLQATGTHRVFMDADGATSIEEMHDFWKHFEAGNDIVFGSRRAPGAEIVKKQPFIREFLGRVANLPIQILLLPGVHDTQCGFKAFTAEAAEAIFPRQTLSRWGFDFEVLTIGKLLGFQAVEVGVRWNDYGESTLNPVKAYVSTFRELMRVWWNRVSGTYREKPQSALEEG